MERLSVEKVQNLNLQSKIGKATMMRAWGSSHLRSSYSAQPHTADATCSNPAYRTLPSRLLLRRFPVHK